MRLNRLVPVFLILFLCGCATTPYSVPLSRKAKVESPGKGIPYYLPHPYLVVTKNLTGATAGKSGSTESQGGAQTAQTTNITVNKSSDKPKVAANDDSGKNDIVLNKDTYAMQVIYLPDPDQKYALYFNKGTGSYDSTITLIDGWKLAGLNIKGDAKTAETIQAIGSAIKDTASAAATTFGPFKAVQQEAAKVRPQVPEVGIWIYDLMGGVPFPCVFTWSSAEKNNK